VIALVTVDVVVAVVVWQTVSFRSVAQVCLIELCHNDRTFGCDDLDQQVSHLWIQGLIPGTPILIVSCLAVESNEDGGSRVFSTKGYKSIGRFDC